MPNNLALASDLRRRSTDMTRRTGSRSSQAEDEGRGVRSPDIADALCLTFAEPVRTARTRPTDSNGAAGLRRPGFARGY